MGFVGGQQGRRGGSKVCRVSKKNGDTEIENERKSPEIGFVCFLGAFVPMWTPIRPVFSVADRLQTLVFFLVANRYQADTQCRGGSASAAGNRNPGIQKKFKRVGPSVGDS